MRRTAHVFLGGLLAAASSAGTCNAQYVVTSLADSGPNTLRAALEALEASAPAAATISVQVAGTVVLSRALPLLPAGTRVTLAAVGFGPTDRLVLDARPFSGSPVNGLVIRGSGTRLEVPLTLFVHRGNGIAVMADGVHLADLEVHGSDVGVTATGISSLSIDRLQVVDAGIGLNLDRCNQARIGSNAAGQRVRVERSRNQNLLLQHGSSNRIELFDTTQGTVGVLAIGEQDLRLGVGPARCVVAGSTAIGIQLAQCVRPTVAGVDVSGARLGMTIEGCANASLQECAIDQAATDGVVVLADSRDTTVGPHVLISNCIAGKGLVLQARATIVETTCGSGNEVGLFVGPGAHGARIDACAILGNYYGIIGVQATDLTIVGTRVERNGFAGIELGSCARAHVSYSAVTGNYGRGVSIANGSDDAVVGPANYLDTNSSDGLFAFGVARLRVEGNTSISDNKNAGVEVVNCPGAWITGNQVTANRGVGIQVSTSDDVTVGPGNVVQGSLGGGIRVEAADNVVITGCKVLDSNTAGVMFVVNSKPVNVARGNRIESTLIARSRDAGVMYRALVPTVPIHLAGCTVTENYRGIHLMGGDPQATGVFVDSSILWGNQLDDYSTAPSSSGIVECSHSIVQNPPGAGTNLARDPWFRDPRSGDWHLQPYSPAVDAASAQLNAAATAGAVDCDGRPRSVNCWPDLGALEVQHLRLAQDWMPNGGGRIQFTIDYPPSEAGRSSLVVFSLAGPQPGRRLFRRCFPLQLDDWSVASLGMLFTPVHQNVAAVIPPHGTVEGALNYSGLLPPALSGIDVYAAAVSLDGLRAQLVTNPVRFTIR